VNQFGDPFQVMVTQMGQLKCATDQSTGRGSDDDLIGVGQSLQTRREIGCAAYRQLGLIPRTRLFADHDAARSDADPNRQVLGRRGPLDRINDFQSRPRGTLGIFLVRGRPAEIRQDAITHVAGNKPVVARDDIPAEGSILVQQAPQFFGVELLAQRRRAHQIAEHDGELAAFAT
jgi:hypothetical protein